MLLDRELHALFQKSLGPVSYRDMASENLPPSGDRESLLCLRDPYLPGDSETERNEEPCSRGPQHTADLSIILELDTFPPLRVSSAGA